MALFLARRIIKGQTTFDKVPKALKEEVKEILIKEGYIITEV